MTGDDLDGNVIEWVLHFWVTRHKEGGLWMLMEVMGVNFAVTLADPMPSFSLTV